MLNYNILLCKRFFYYFIIVNKLKIYDREFNRVCNDIYLNINYIKIISKALL